MKSAIFATLVLLAGCGGYYRDPVYPPPPPPVDPQYPDAFLVDANVGVVAEPNTYAITTDGNVWRLTWLGDRFPHKFRGTVRCPAGCQFGYARFQNAYPGDTVTVDRDRISFDAVTDAAVPQTLDLQAPLQPLEYYLLIDGYEAIGSVVFQSQGALSTTDVMPFSLYSSNSGLKAEQKTKLAPQFISLLPKDSTEKAMIQPPGQGSTAASSGAAAK